MIAETVLILSILALGYTYVGYPAILWIACLFRPRAPAPDGNPVRSVSVVVCARNEEKSVAPKIRNLAAQQGMPDRYDIVMASDGSTDATAAVARAAAAESAMQLNVTVLEFPANRGKAAVLNEVIPQCRGEIVVLADARQAFAPDAIQNLCRRFADPAVGAVSGELVFKRGETDTASSEGVGSYWRYEKTIREMESCLDSTCGCTGALYAIRRDLYRPIHPDTVLDDVAIPMLILMQGKRIVFEKTAKAYDEPSADLAQENRRKVRTLAGNFQLLALHPELLNPFRNRIWFQLVSHKLMRLFCPWFLLALFVASAALALTDLWVRALFVLQTLFYLVAALGLLLQGRRLPLLLSLPATFVSLNWAAVLGTFRFLRGNLSGRWE